MRRIIAIQCAILFSVTIRAGAGGASWFIDKADFHVSAHGRLSCQDCHGSVAGEALHPDPDNVGGRPPRFHAEPCLSCHDDVAEDLQAGIHGGKRIEKRAGYGPCVSCHPPHEPHRLDKGRTGGFDPERPPSGQCGACHEVRSALPEFGPEDERCMVCHGRLQPGDPRGGKRIAQLCFYCHGRNGTDAQERTGARVSLIQEKDYETTPHAGVACLVCHPGAAAYGHGEQEGGECRDCHRPHDEKVARDAHMSVACEACHLGGVEPVRDPVSKSIRWKRPYWRDRPSAVHHMVRGGDDAACRRCHDKGNRVGAATMILPAKSVICMPCHAATFSVGDTTTVISLVLFLLGVVSALSLWLSGTLPGRRPDAGPVEKVITLGVHLLRAVFSHRILLLAKVMILEVLLQRRLFRQSAMRWAIHSLIFVPFVFRFLWGLLAWGASICRPEWSWFRFMLDQNHPATALLFDLTGGMVILGVCAAVIRGVARRSERLPGTPRQDYPALGLIAAVVIVGFILEGLRIFMTGTPPGASTGFIGRAVSRLFSDAAVVGDAYGSVWYIHAILTGVFWAYLPFSGMFHIILAPAVLALHAVRDREEKGAWGPGNRI